MSGRTPGGRPNSMTGTANLRALTCYEPNAATGNDHVYIQGQRTDPLELRRQHHRNRDAPATRQVTRLVRAGDSDGSRASRR
ncbi:hypothetical protein ACFYNW_24755 [Streptomyces virginiae]|uniref:hypothetical protein n=1 Tax=Streptomyces virginiae TaxID=1961 RepID=UPI0036EFDFA9